MQTLIVKGNQITNEEGKSLWLQGVAIPSLEWDPNGVQMPFAFDQAIQDWKANIIRMPVHSTFWFGKEKLRAGQKPALDSSADACRMRADRYRKLCDTLIEQAARQGCYVILDLHEFKAPTEVHRQFWLDAAKRYANNPAVLFGLFNEAHSVSWKVWRDGGRIDDNAKQGVIAENNEHPDLEQTIGHQALIDACRSVGAKNIVLAGGLDWAYDLRGLAEGYALADPDGNGIVYDSHIYPWKNGWDSKVLRFADRYPILLGEVGCREKCMPFQTSTPDPYVWAPAMLACIQRYRLHWTAWSFHWQADPNIALDPSYTPTPCWGAFVRAALRGAKFANTQMW